MFLFRVFIVLVVITGRVKCISNKNESEKLPEALLNLSNFAIQERQNRPLNAEEYYQQYYSQGQRYPSYQQQYYPQKYQYGYPQEYYPNKYPHDYNNNEVYQHYTPPYPSYPKPPYINSPFIQKTQQSVMDALFSISQNDDLQCVPKLLCDITSGGLIGKQAGLNLPVNVNLESLTALLSGVNSANMSPILHFGKAAVLGLAAKGNTKSCQYAYPECPSDPEKLILYLNNHNGGFFRFFQGINSVNPYDHQQNYAKQFGVYHRSRYFDKSAAAEKRIQNQPLSFNNIDFDRDTYYKEHRGLPQFFYTTPISYETVGPKRVAFPNQYAEPTRHHTARTILKFPLEDTSDPFRRGKKLQYNPYLDIQRPLPNHVPTPNILPDRTGTGELKLDLDELEKNYQQSLAYDNDNNYNQLLYDSFPRDHSKPLSFPG